MKTKTILVCISMLAAGLVLGSCCRTQNRPTGSGEADVTLKDFGPDPAVLNIEAYTTANDNFRTVLWTGDKMQITLMSIPVGGDVGLEDHPQTDQFFRVEQGQAKVVMGDSKDSLDFVATAGPDFAIFIPAGKWHNIINTGDTPLKLYSIYAPPEHPRGAVHKTQQDEIEAEHQ